MTIDDRLKALTHSAELPAQMHLENERRSDERVGKFVRSIERLAAIAESHEHRIDGLGYGAP